MLDPIPAVVTEAGDSQDAPSGAIPVALYGAGGGGGGGSSTTDAITIEGTSVDGLDGMLLSTYLIGLIETLGTIGQRLDVLEALDNG